MEQTTTQNKFYPICLDEILHSIKKSRVQKYFYQKPLLNVKEIRNQFNEKIVRVDGHIPIDLKVKTGSRFLFISYEQSALTHGLHKYPAKFFPELPRWIIERYSKKGALVIDPFTGSGTTNLEALLLERNSVGIDIDPFSLFLSRVKTNALDETDLLSAKNELIETILSYNASAIDEKDIPVFPYRDNWFNKEILLELSYIKKEILKLNYGIDIQEFFLSCFSSIIRAVSNADDHCTRTVIRKKLNKQVFPADALKKFVRAVLLNVPRIISFSEKVPQGFYVQFPSDMDARNIKYPDETFDLAVTSPPYLNAVDYPRTHQLEMYWLNMANGSLSQLKAQHIGTERVSAVDYKDFHKIGIKSADEVMKKIFLQDKRRAFICFKYLLDMQKNLIEVFRTLKKNGRYVIVVGNNKVRGQTFENWKYFIVMAKKIGFLIDTYFGSEIIKHFIKVPRQERINTDWVLVLKK